MLRDRDDRVHDFAVRYSEVRSGSFPAVATPGGPDDRGGNGDAEDGAGAEARVGTDAGSEVGHFDGGVLKGWGAVQCLFGFAGGGSNSAGGRVCRRMAGAARGGLFFPAGPAGEN